jgi:hypothetical protein
VGNKPEYTPELGCTKEEYDLLPDMINLKNMCLEYLEKDCIGLSQVLTTFSKTVYDICKLNPLNSYSISTFSNKV